ncbi:MAG TPA: ABC-F family ATP-binding cassette domain-containing protein [Gemmataceae bacterium]|jgi:ATP-binding cassette subfamily F protein 3|nr:ABC-F family ATP-binding cassette domain-containing protein [Gemmataceae bacterium]
MTVLLQIAKATKSYGEQILLDEADATITDDENVGFIGRNGAGKSTLLRVLLGEEELDSGEVIRHPSLRLGYLRQHDPFLPGETALQFLMRDSGEPDWKCGEVAGDFELKGAYLDGPIAKMSGGWQTRVKLAALLLHEPNLLLLDEPTNFLDLRTQILLEHFLKNHRAACLIVSHDRAFLAATCEHTLSLSRGKLTSFPGKVDAFLEYQAEQRVHLERSNENILAKKKHLEDFIARNKARAATATLARSKAKQLERLELNEIEVDEPTARILAPRVEPRKGPALRCRDLVIGYPEREIASDVQLEIDHGTRAAVVGDNGQGKTTFLRTIVESLKPLSGDVRWGHGCQIGVYAQHVYTSLPENQTVLDYLHRQAARGKNDQQILQVAGSLLFRGAGTEKPISVLSGGERARLCLAGLLLSAFNILILDEPGNHLDVDTVDALAEALVEYQGTVIFTSHDRHFTRRVATAIVEVRDGRVVNYGGKYDAYVDKVNAEIEAGERELATQKAKAPAAVLKAAPKPKKPHRDEKVVRKEIKTVEKTIATLDEEKKTLAARSLETLDAAEALRVHNELVAVTQQLAEAEDRWCKLQEELDDE